jgi:ubiquinone/menaquinone biosynthesis C-methylase UbiE
MTQSQHQSTESAAVNTPQVVPTREGYDRWAASYDVKDNSLIVLETPRVRQLLGEVRGLIVADIGCGTGRHAFPLAATGATVVALDMSMGMLAQARAKVAAAAVHFVYHDLTQGLPFVSAVFDRVMCCLVLAHVADLHGAMAELARICRPDGYVVLSDLHPAMQLRDIQAQFTDPLTGRKIRPASVTHQLSEYVMAATQAGLCIEHMSEHLVEASLIARFPRLQPYVGWPYLLVMLLRRLV